VSDCTREDLLRIAKRVNAPVALNARDAGIVERLARLEAMRMPTDPADELTAEAQRLGLYPLPIRRVGTWWIVRGRHGTGFHRFDATNMTEAEAQAQAQRLLPTITDDQVTAMYEMMQEGKA